jgi:5-methylthioadenosine/S-adenosylhomocysteine deaminase
VPGRHGSSGRVSGSRTLIRGGLVLTMDPSRPEPFTGDLLIEDGVIVAAAPSVEKPAGAKVIDGSRRLVTPGLVNAHMHSFESTYRGRYERLPMELWSLYGYPTLGAEPLDDELLYLRTMVVAIESLRNGVTTILDDIDEWSGQTIESLEPVFRAYAASGMRASCSGNFQNRFDVDVLPHADELVPPSARALLTSGRTPTDDEYLAFLREAAARFHRPTERQRFVIAPCGPQWCTESLLVESHRLARELGTNYHVHALETRVQIATQRTFYDDTLIAFMDELGVLDEATTIAHAIWVTDRDVERLAASGAAVVHNPISNLKLGAGTAPLRALLDAGVPVGLGTDGPSCNDSARLFDTIRVAALLHSGTSLDHATWPTAREIVEAATRGGARAAFVHDQVGTLEVGKRADLVLFNLDTINFTPLSDVYRQLAYSENGTSIELVMVDGDVVVEGGRCTKVDEEATLSAFRDRLGNFARYHERLEERYRQFEPHIAAIHRRCAAETADFTQAGSAASVTR